jgi:hypothetical protein
MVRQSGRITAMAIILISRNIAVESSTPEVQLYHRGMNSSVTWLIFLTLILKKLGFVTISSQRYFIEKATSNHYWTQVFAMFPWFVKKSTYPTPIQLLHQLLTGPTPHQLPHTSYISKGYLLWSLILMLGMVRQPHPKNTASGGNILSDGGDICYG